MMTGADTRCERSISDTTDHVDSDYFFSTNDEDTLLSELQRTQNQSTLQESIDSNEHPNPLVICSFTDDSDDKSELPQSNGHTTDDEDIPSDDDQQSGRMSQQTLHSK